MFTLILLDNAISAHRLYTIYSTQLTQLCEKDTSSTAFGKQMPLNQNEVVKPCKNQQEDNAIARLSLGRWIILPKSQLNFENGHGMMRKPTASVCEVIWGFCVSAERQVR